MPSAKRGERQLCIKATAKGPRCKRRALEGLKVCAVHAGAPVGRPSKLTPDAIEKILEVLRLGGYVETAAQVAGVARDTFHGWIERGDPAGTKREDQPYRDFRKRVDQARAEGEQANVAIIRTAARSDWKAAAWMLERQFPERWAGPRSRAPGSRIGDPYDTPGAGADDAPAPRVMVGPDGAPL